MNLPNKLTCLRAVMIIPFVLLMLLGKCEGPSRYIALAVFILASLTDMLDGYIARSRNLITDFGKFMDPLADKLLVASALICLVELERLPAWICIIIISREFVISGFRLIASDNGVVIAASMWGKVKTVTQMAAVILLILDHGEGLLHTLAFAVTIICAVLTVVSLADYILKNKQVILLQK